MVMTSYLGKSPIKWRKRPDMTIAVDWDVKHKFKQTNKSFVCLLKTCSV